MTKEKINFSSHFIKANIFSIALITISVFVIFFKGLNYGIDFKGGTLIEIRVQNTDINTSQIRTALKNMNLGDINVKKFGNNLDYLIKIEATENQNSELIPVLKKTISESNFLFEIWFKFKIESFDSKIWYLTEFL